MPYNINFSIVMLDYLPKHTLSDFGERIFFAEELKEEMKVSPLVFSLCMGCSKNNCFRIFTCKTWSNSILYAVGEKYIWFSKNGEIVDGNKKGKIYTLEQSLEYCKRKRDPWIELTTVEEVKNFLERSGYGH